MRKKPREVVDKRAFVFDPETSQAEGGGAGSARTTLMIKNIPNKYSQKMLLATLDKSCAGRCARRCTSGLFRKSGWVRIRYGSGKILLRKEVYSNHICR